MEQYGTGRKLELVDDARYGFRLVPPNWEIVRPRSTAKFSLRFDARPYGLWHQSVVEIYHNSRLAKKTLWMSWTIGIFQWRSAEKTWPFPKCSEITFITDRRTCGSYYILGDVGYMDRPKRENISGRAAKCSFHAMPLLTILTAIWSVALESRNKASKQIFLNVQQTWT